MRACSSLEDPLGIAELRGAFPPTPMSVLIGVQRLLDLQLTDQPVDIGAPL